MGTDVTSLRIWRLAALSMMCEEQRQSALTGKDAILWIRAAAESGVCVAQLSLGRMLLTGVGVAKDETAAKFWFERAAHAGDPDARNMLARCYESGWGTPRDPIEAAKHYTISAHSGCTWAQYNLGHLYLNGIGVRRHLPAAYLLYRQAAQQGHERAMNLVGRCHEQGWGCAKDRMQARRWYKQSAQCGYFRGAYNFASILVEDGCLTGAMYWFSRAIGGAPEPTRIFMLSSLSCSSQPLIQALARNLSK